MFTVLGYRPSMSSSAKTHATLIQVVWNLPYREQRKTNEQKVGRNDVIYAERRDARVQAMKSDR